MWVGCRFMARALPSRYICHRITPLAKSRTKYLLPANLSPYKRISSSSTMNPIFSAGEDENQLMADVKPLLEHGWTLDKEGMGLEKTYYFKFNSKVRTFYDSIAIEMDIENHHAKVITEFKVARVLWTTHTPRGLSSKDIRMARYSDERAKAIGEVEKSQIKTCTSALTSQI